MTGLLKADFKRLLKDKLLLILGILAIVFAVIMPVLNALIFSGVDKLMGGMFTTSLTAKSLFFASFNMGDNMGLIAPILLGIALCKDFSYGTIRNKIIAGKSRSAIFLSLFISCSAIFLAVMLLHAFVTLGVSLCLFEYQATPFTCEDFCYLLESLAFDMLAMLYVTAMLSWLCASAKNVGIVIVIYIAISFVLSISGGLMQTALVYMENFGGNEKTITLLSFLDRINVVTSAVYIGTGSEYTWKDVLYLTIPATVGIVSFLGLGLWRFNKKDLK